MVAAGIGVRFDEWLFRGVDLEVGPGECAAVVGANGSGKSTLLRCLHGEEPVTEGTVLVDGAPPDERSAAFRRAVSVLRSWLVLRRRCLVMLCRVRWLGTVRRGGRR